MVSERRPGWHLQNWLLEVPVEQVIACSRLVLAAVALIAIYLDPTQPAKYADETYLILLCYLAFAIGVFWLSLVRSMASVFLVLTLLVDLGTVALLMDFTEGPTSPFFVFFTFILLAAALRWDWRGALSTLAVLFVLLFALALNDRVSEISEDRDRFILRVIYLLVAGAMISYFGTFRDRSRLRFAKLAAWPVEPETGKLALNTLLAHAADVLSTSRILCAWEYPEEPYWHFWYWEDGVSESTREFSSCPISALITPKPSAAILVDKNGRSLEPRRSSFAIDPSVRQKYRIGTAVIGPFSNASCAGFVLGLDCTSCNDLLSLTSIIADRMAAEIGHEWLWKQMQIAAAEKERLRLARNVHDGVLQTLTATALNLKVCAKNADPKAREELEAMRGILAKEQQRVRALLTSPPPSSTSRSFALAAEGKRIVSELGAYWHCEIPLEVKPEGAKIPVDVARHVHLILAEAVANAAKHGKASRVAINLERCAETLDVQILDNGSGFRGLSGTYDREALKALHAGPRSICERVQELGGILTLSTSSTGSKLTVRLPT
jgi:signal transduction histidine kinase